MAGEICPVRQGGNQSERNLRRPRSCATCTFRSEKISSKTLTISGVDRFTRRGGTCRLHAIFMNQLRIIWGYQEELSSTAGHGEKNSPRAYVVRSIQSSVHLAGSALSPLVQDSSLSMPKTAPPGVRLPGLSRLPIVTAMLPLSARWPRQGGAAGTAKVPLCDVRAHEGRRAPTRPAQVFAPDTCKRHERLTGRPLAHPAIGKCTRAPAARAVDSARLRIDSHQSTQPRLLPWLQPRRVPHVQG